MIAYLVSALPPQPRTGTVAAVSVGNIGGVLVLDLDCEEDVKPETDMKVVCTGDGRFVEVQGTAEGQPFDRTEIDALLGQVPWPGRLGAAVGDGETGQLGP